MKSGVIPASSNNTAAYTLPEWEEKRFNSSPGISGWAVLATKRKVSAILLPVRYLVMPNLLTDSPIGCELDWPSLLAQRKILYAAQTGQMSGWSSSVTKVSFWPFCLFFLYSKCDSQFSWKILWFTVWWVDADGSTGVIVKFPINWEKGYYNSLAQWIDMFVDHCLSFLCVLGATQTSNLHKDHPIGNICFKGIGGWMFFCQLFWILNVTFIFFGRVWTSPLWCFHDPVVLIIKDPICWQEGFRGAFAWWVFVHIYLRFGLLCILDNL